MAAKLQESASNTTPLATTTLQTTPTALLPNQHLQQVILTQTESVHREAKAFT